MPTDEPEPALVSEVPPAPSWLSARAAIAWKTVAKELHKAEMLAALDLAILELFAVSYDQWRSALEGIAAEGYTYRAYDDEGNIRFAQQTPEAVLASKFAADINKWAKVLGLGPAYRVGLRIGTDPSGKPTVDPIAAALAGAGMDSTAINPPKPRKKAATAQTRKKPAAAKKPPPKSVENQDG